MCSLVSVFTLFYLILENMSTNVRTFAFLVIFDTCDVVYNWLISLLPPIVLDYLFGSILKDINLFLLIINLFCKNKIWSLERYLKSTINKIKHE